MAHTYTPLAPFTLESLVASRQWSAEQRGTRKKASAEKPESKPQPVQSDPKQPKIPE